MNALFDLARVTTPTVGTGPLSLGSPVAGFLTFAQSGVPDGATISYGISDGPRSEVGWGVYNAAGTLTRNVYRSTAGGSNTGLVPLSGAAQVFITALAEDFASLPPGPTGPQGPVGPQGEPGISAGRIFYYDATTNSDIAGYKKLLTSPSPNPEKTIAVVVTGTNTDTPVEEFATDAGVPGVVDYPAGTAYRRIYARVSSGGVARLHLQIYVRNGAGVETLARDEYSANFNNTTVALQEWISTPSTAGAMAATDRLVNKLSAQRISGGGTVTVTCHFEGSSTGSHIQTTISTGSVGPAGPGVPVGGASGDVLSKINATDYNTQWIAPAAGTVTSVAAGAGLTASPSPIVGAGTMSLAVPVSIANGGTNAITAPAALTSLGAYAASNPSGYQTAAQVTTALAPYAPLAAPVFTGDARAVTPATADNDTSIATTAFVKAQNYLAGNQTITLSGDLSGSGATAIAGTLATVNSNVGTFQGLTVNAKGLVTAAANQSYLTGNQSITLSGAITGSGTTSIATTLATVPVASGGTNLTTYVQGDIIYASAPTTLARLAKDATATRYLSNAGATNNPAWAAVNLANGVTGTLPVANGGTGAATAAPAGAATPGTIVTVSNTAGQMFGANFQITPRLASARIAVMICGQETNNTAGVGQYLEGRYGTGTPPATNAASAGTNFAGGLLYNIQVANNSIPFALMKVITGLVAGTPYWFDIHIIPTGGTAAISNVSISAFEV